jgi:NAD+ kinase
VLVFQKNTARRRVVGGPARKDGEGEDPLALSLKRSRQTHLRAIETLQVVLDRLGISARFVWLTDRVDSTGFDLVIALGGDGTVLHASHQIGPTPMLAINSAPEHSVGYLTAVPI